MAKSFMYLAMAVFVLGAVAACSKPLEPVKETHIGGMPLDSKTEVFSKLNTSVTPDAVVQVPGKQESIIANIFPADENANVLSGAKPEIIMANNTDNFKLNKTMSKKNLAKGTYLMNIVYGGQTERVVFSVK